jgi:hypothetical protein
MKARAVAPPPEIPRHPDYPYSIDLYTQYESPYGGQGYRRPSDAFPPQAEISLFASLTYFGDAVAGKPVSYTISGPNGIQYSAVATTNSQGIAELKYILPWVASFGLWKATASWQVGSKIISDELSFRVGYLVEVKNIKLEKVEDAYTDPRDNKVYPVYYKGKTYTLDFDLSVISLQSPATIMKQLIGDTKADVWTAILIVDELGQPAAYTGLNTRVATEDYYKYVDLYVKDVNTTEQTHWGTDNKFISLEMSRTVSFKGNSVTIGPNAFSGKASIYGSVLTKLGGVPYGVPSEPTLIWIRKGKEVPYAPPAAPSLKVSSVKAPYNKPIKVNIIISDVNPDAHIVAVEFRVKFDKTYLNAINVTEGDFVKQFGDTFFTYYIEEDVLVGILQLPPWPGEAGWMSGTGTLAVIEFKSLYTAPPPATTIIDLSDAHFVDADGNMRNFKNLESGTVTITS